MSPIQPYGYNPRVASPTGFFGARAERVPVVETAPEDPERDRKEQLLKTARQRFRNILEYESEMRREMLEDFNFRAGKQWDLQAQNERMLANRPCLTINRINPVIKIIVNEIRQNRASIVINPVGNGADRDTADVLEGITRHIEIRSDADSAYDTAAEHQVTCGRGWLRVLVDWVPGTMDQEIRIERIPNPFAVLMDTAASHIDFSDAQFGFIVEDLDQAAFERKFPGKVFSPLRDFEGIGQYADWYPERKCRVAEYFYLEPQSVTISQLDDGSILEDDDVIPAGRTIVAERDETKQQVKWAKITAREVLEERDWLGEHIPIVPVLGDEILLDNKRQYIGLTRYARDPQRMFNYMRTAATEAISLVPKAMWLAAEGQIENFEEFYRTSNTRNISVLYYKPVSSNGQPLAVPQRLHGEVDLTSISAALAQSDQDFKIVTNVFDPSLGQHGPEESGRAILARQKQTDTATFSFGDNQAKAIRQIGRIIMELIPHVYSTGQMMHIVNPDGTRKPVILNHPFVQGPNGQPQPVDPRALAAQQTGQTLQTIKMYNVRQGEYDVSVSSGPSYQSRRQDAATSMIEFLKAYPQAGPLVGDLVAGNMDWPGAAEFAERLKKMLPPALQDQQGGQPQVNPQQLMSALQGLQQQNQQLMQLIQGRTLEKRLELTSKERTAAADRASRERIADKQAMASVIGNAERAHSASADKLAGLDYAATEHRLNLFQDQQLAQVEAANELSQAEAERAHELELQQQDHQHDQQQLDQQQQFQQQQPPPAGPETQP